MTQLGRRRGKNLERFIAKDLDGRRVGILGQEDVRLSCGLAVEAKERQRLPAFIVNCMTQAEKNADGDAAIVILHELGKNHNEDIVMIRYQNFKQIMRREQ